MDMTDPRAWKVFHDMSRELELAIFTGRIRNRVGTFCDCHDQPITTNGFSMMDAYPACSVTRADLGPDQFYSKSLPDLVWSETEKRLVEEDPNVTVSRTT